MNKYTCIKCGTDFEIEHEIEENGALCTPCFNVFKKLDFEGTRQFMMTAKRPPGSIGLASEGLYRKINY